MVKLQKYGSLSPAHEIAHGVVFKKTALQVKLSCAKRALYGYQLAQNVILYKISIICSDLCADKSSLRSQDGIFFLK
jgi:hypothetical protein